jgi:hypothetical protein
MIKTCMGLNRTCQILDSFLQKVHPVVLAYALSTVRQNTTIFKQLIHITCVNGFIEVQLYYMFRLMEPSSDNTCLQQFSQIIKRQTHLLITEDVK